MSFIDIFYISVKGKVAKNGTASHEWSEFNSEGVLEDEKHIITLKRIGDMVRVETNHKNGYFEKGKK